jgi:hypothetical protein
MKRFALALILVISGPALASAQQEFWAWFESVADRLDPDSPDPIMVEDMGYWLGRVSADLSFELGKRGRERVLTLSADGRQALVPLVDKFVGEAPQIRGWKLVSLRPREKTLRSVMVGGITLDPGRLHFDLYDDGPRFGVVLYVPEFHHESVQYYRRAAMRLMSMSIGEREVASWIGFVDFDRQGVRDIQFSRPFAEFRDAFERLDK